MAISRLRRYAASAAMFTASGALAYTEIANRHWGVDWLVVAIAAAMGAAGFGLARKSLYLQILSRATAWCAFLPMAIIAGAQLLSFHQTPDRLVLLLGAMTGGALLLARPMLHSKEAKAAFDPVRFRRTFMAGATAATSASMVTGLATLELFKDHHFGSGFALGALATSLFASALGILRMRGWSVLLGAATSALTLLVAAFMHEAVGLALACAAVPGLVLTLPIIASRIGGKDASPRLRVESTATEEPAARIRIADPPVEMDEPVEQPRARAQVG